jgi:hypothetical protein
VNVKGGGKGGGDAKKGEEEAGVGALSGMGYIRATCCIRVTDQSRWRRSDFRRCLMHPDRFCAILLGDLIQANGNLATFARPSRRVLRRLLPSAGIRSCGLY